MAVKMQSGTHDELPINYGNSFPEIRHADEAMIRREVSSAVKELVVSILSILIKKPKNDI